MIKEGHSFWLEQILTVMNLKLYFHSSAWNIAYHLTPLIALDAELCRLCYKQANKQTDKHENIIIQTLLRIRDTNCSVAPLHFNWDSSGLLPSSQKIHFSLLQTWFAGQSFPTSHFLPRPFKNEQSLMISIIMCIISTILRCYFLCCYLLYCHLLWFLHINPFYRSFQHLLNLYCSHQFHINIFVIQS